MLQFAIHSYLNGSIFPFMAEDIEKEGMLALLIKMAGNLNISL